MRRMRRMCCTQVLPGMLNVRRMRGQRGKRGVRRHAMHDKRHA
jgi:hypothetical protein